MRKNIQRGDEDDLPEDLKPLPPVEPERPAAGCEDVNKWFLAFGGDPKHMESPASLTASNLCIAKQIAMLIKLLKSKGR